MKLIGITGKKGSGKSTFAEAIKTFYANEYQRNVIRAGFAQPLKQICYEMFGGHLDNYYGSEEKKNVATPYWKETLGFTLDADGKHVPNDEFDTYRRIMQTVGTRIFRENFDNDFWVIVMQNRYNAAKEGFNSVFVIDDVRYDNEANWIISKGGTIYSLTPPPTRNFESNDSHSSEKGLSKDIPTTQLSFLDHEHMKAYIKSTLHQFVFKKLEDCK